MITLLSVYKGKGVQPGAVDLLYELLEERPAKANISHCEKPSHEKHEAFVMSRPYRAWYLVLNDDLQRVGAVYLTKQNEIGVAILKRYHRLGYALQALNKVRKISPLPGIPGQRNARYVAHVAANNEASKFLFAKAGGRLLSVTYVL